MSDPFARGPVKEVEFNLKGQKVMLALPVNRDFPWQTAASLMQAQRACFERGILLDVQFVTGCSLVDKARNEIVHAFLKSDFERLFWIDSDIEFDAKDFIRLLCLSQKMQIVGASYPMKIDEPTFVIKTQDNKHIPCNEWNCMEVDGFGHGFVVVHKDVYLKLSIMAPKVKYHNLPEPVAQVYNNGIFDDEYLGEDIFFFKAAQGAGFKVHLDPSFTVGHVGSKVYRGNISNSIRKAQAE